MAQRWQKKIASFDGFIFTAAEYNRGPTAVLKNALDYAYKRMEQEAGRLRRLWRRRRRARGRAVSPACGRAADGAGQSAVHIAWGDFVAVKQDGKKLEDFEHLNQAATALLNDLAWWAKVLKAAREADAIAAEAKAA